MRRSLHVLIFMAAFAVAAPASQAAQYPVGPGQTTIQDLLGLKASGMGDDLVIGLFQSDGTVFNLTADDLIYLRQQGLSERVLLAMLGTRRPRPEPSDVQPVSAPSAQSSDPVVVNVDQQVSQTVRVERVVERVIERPSPRTRVVHVPVAVPVRGVRLAPRPAPEPVYWGFGGKRRPDSWDPTPRPATRNPPGVPKPLPRGRGGGGGGG